ncbi:hypothetical protein [Flavobacterium microcysteis]|uniref:Uncharacterized protein n=1 Tax=Flavobacterium microcysteis TaxID=2596891 RepID=A0A501QJH3_9FLAO|nr:hypothetical protein [Flavobacterium microcysteis]TPD72265.1 hypothetical protein FJA49_02585 [Flavobacterium microcysteis]
MLKHLSIILCFLSCISINQQDIENDIAGVIDVFDQQRIKDSAGKPSVYVCDEILPIDNALGIKEYLISKKDVYPDFNIDGYFNNQTQEKVFLQKIPNKKIFSAKTLNDIYLKMTKREDFWNLYEKSIGKSGYWKFYLPIYNKDRTEFFLYFEENDFKMGGANRLCLFKREGNTIILKDLFLIGF